MTDLIERLRALSRHEHDDLSIGEEAADEIERLRATLISSVGQGVSEILTERDALRARIEGAPFKKADKARGVGARLECEGLPIEWVGKRVALIRLECE